MLIIRIYFIQVKDQATLTFNPQIHYYWTICYRQVILILDILYQLEKSTNNNYKAIVLTSVYLTLFTQANVKENAHRQEYM